MNESKPDKQENKLLFVGFVEHNDKIMVGKFKSSRWRIMRKGFGD